ncbi:MAG TPA: hypothetical protein VGX68_25820 [Thermoanaerobaculia bacterium]|jgi:hypothetical protein|nr:hypothetical protein [Thermoanaerobaculia bacterium]
MMTRPYFFSGHIVLPVNISQSHLSLSTATTALVWPASAFGRNHLDASFHRYVTSQGSDQRGYQKRVSIVLPFTERV